MNIHVQPLLLLYGGGLKYILNHKFIKEDVNLQSWQTMLSMLYKVIEGPVTG